MTQIASGGVGLKNQNFNDTNETWLLDSSVTSADVGKPMSVSANETLIVAATDARVIGKLQTFENRLGEGIKVGALIRHGFHEWDYDAADTVALNDSVVGGAATGKVKKGTDARNQVVSIDTTNKKVVVLIS